MTSGFMFTKKYFMQQTTTLEREYKLKIGGNVRKWRNLKSIKQKQLASYLKLSEAAVSNIENDITNVNLRQLEDIANAMEVRVEQLLCDPEETYTTTNQNNSKPVVYEKELLNAIITSLEKKDEQLHKIMENVIHTMSSVIREDKSVR